MTDILTPPQDAVITPMGSMWLSSDGILITISNFASHKLDDAKENMRITGEVGGGIPRPLLVDISNVRSMSKEAREEYVRSGGDKIVTAVALITTSNVGNMIGNLFINLSKHEVPVKLFTDAEKAIEWLKQYRVESN